jgi:abequosyltransferase
MPTLSFVIPTLNFGAFLPEMLDSIVGEGYAPVEIIVFDGGSTDDTLQVLERYRARFPALKVIVATERGNIDTDLNQAVAAATGDYVWSVSADDVLMPGWSRTVAPFLEAERPDLLLVPAIHCDIRMQPRRNYPILKQTGLGPQVIELKSDYDTLDYLGRVRTSEGLFSFCTACLVRRERLDSAPLLEQANGTCWRYAARLIGVLTAYPSKIAVLDTPLVFKRGDNDSFSSSGKIHRLRIATLNWDVAIGSLSLEPSLSQAMLALVKSDIRPLTLLYMSQFVRNEQERATFSACVDTRLGNPEGRVGLVGYLLKRVPRWSVLQWSMELAKKFLRRFQQRLWSARLPGL